MSDGRMPREISALIEKGSTEPLSPTERQMLSGYAITARGQAPPELLTYIDFLLAKPPADPTGLQPAGGQPGTGNGSPFDALGALARGAADTAGSVPALPFTTDPIASRLPGAGELMAADQASASPAMEASSQLEATRVGDAPMSSVFGLTGEPPYRNSDNTDDTLPLQPEGQVPPRRGERRRDKEDWVGQRNALAGVDVGAMPEGSAFAGIDPGMLPGFASNPDLAARQIAESRGGGAASSAILAPQLRAAMGLDAAGVLSGNRQLGGGRGAGDRLALSEAFVNSVGPGEFVNPNPVFRQSLKNANRTPVGEMFSTGEGTPGDITNQVATTNDALAAAAPYMTQDAVETLAGQLQSAGDEYILGVANGTINMDEMSYPRWLKEQKKAKRWVSKGLSQEDIANAF